MNVAALDKNELQRWLDGALNGSDLIQGKVFPIQINRARVTAEPGWELVGQAASPVISISSMEANAHPTLASFLRTNSQARDVVTRVDQLILRDSRIGNGGVAGSFPAAVRLVPVGPIGAILGAVPQFDVPSTKAFPPYSSDAVPDDQVLFVHPGTPITYLIDATADIVARGPTADLLLVATVLRPPRQLGAAMTRVHF